jgi:hypothetical protein
VITENGSYYGFPKQKSLSLSEGVAAKPNFYDGTVFKATCYDVDDELVATTNDIDYPVLPQQAKQYISEKYPG